MKISELVHDAYHASRAKGFHDDHSVTFGDRIALCHTELSEAMETYRCRPDDGYTWGPFDPIYLDKETGKLTREPYHYGITRTEETPDGVRIEYWGNVLHKPEGVPAELADVVIRVADMCGLYGIDLERAIVEKMAYNKTRPYKHGKKL